MSRLESLIEAATERESALEAALEEEQRRREEAERELVALRAELERLQRER